DDIQGTAAVTVATLIAASRAQGKQLKDQTITFVGAGSAGCGIAEHIVRQMIDEGLSDHEARSRIFMVDRFGLMTDQQENLLDFQQKLATPVAAIQSWEGQGKNIALLDVVQNAKPSILIGVSGQAGLFSEEVIKTLAKYYKHPIVLPLSNPTSQVEAQPKDIIEWTQGAAIVATGSPFAPVFFQGKAYPIAQCNNSYIFPGIGLGVIACGATHISDSMLMAASTALADCSPRLKNPAADLLPSINDIQQVSKFIAFKVAKAAMADGLAMPMSNDVLKTVIDDNFWTPAYRQYSRVTF
ncbi:MAG: oxaloacetate-decarboxylating malate dehydrogenase, partial [Acinetobacter sp.]|nr:oxaloacetate-decarboxylating malate dehydrogenase [Acinetobacter sp.]